MLHINKQEEIKFFNEKAEVWSDTQDCIKVAKDFIDKYQIGNNNSVLDIGVGTGILYRILKNKNLTDYVAIDIAEKMVEEFLQLHPEADVRQADYERKCFLEKKFDFVIIFDSIPHLRELDIIFNNSYSNLNRNGKFLIVHSKTREGLREHHKKIGYKSEKEPIPGDDNLISLSKKHGFTNIKVEDKEYFIFICEKR